MNKSAGRTAHTALPWPSMGLQPHTVLSASTICRPRPLSRAQSGWRGVGASSLASMTASMTSLARLSRHSLRMSGSVRPSWLGWLDQALQARGWGWTFGPWSGHPGVRGTVPCWTALTTSSPMIVSASSTSSLKPQACRISRVKWRAARADPGEAASTQEVTAGVSHHADGTGRSRGELKPGSESAVPLTANWSPLVPERSRTRGSC
jgi:hypothetical protein